MLLWLHHENVPQLYPRMGGAFKNTYKNLVLYHRLMTMAILIILLNECPVLYIMQLARQTVWQRSICGN